MDLLHYELSRELNLILPVILLAVLIGGLVGWITHKPDETKKNHKSWLALLFRRREYMRKREEDVGRILADLIVDGGKGVEEMVEAATITRKEANKFYKKLGR